MSETVREILRYQAQALREAHDELRAGGDPEKAAIAMSRAAGYMEAVLEELEEQP